MRLAAGGHSVMVKSGWGFGFIVFGFFFCIGQVTMMTSDFILFFSILDPIVRNYIQKMVLEESFCHWLCSLGYVAGNQGRDCEFDQQGDIAACDLLTLALLPYCPAVPAVGAYLC